MFKIIGADGKEYGPIAADIVTKWIAEGRINGQTKVMAEGTTDWRTLAEFPELAAALPIGAPPPGPTLAPDLVSVADQVNGPGIGLIVTGVLNVLLGIVRAAFSITGFGIGAINSGGQNAEMEKMLMGAMGTAGLVLGGVCVLCGAVTLLAGVKLRKLQSYGLCMTGTILAMIPCTSACCLLGLPIGIWALVVMSKPEVKSQFH